MRLTDDLIRRAKRPTKGQTLLWDDLVAGFGVRLTPQRTSFVVQWREPNGKKPRESLRPRWPQLEAMRARDLARKRLSEVLAPSESTEQRELRVVMREWYERQTEIADWRPRYRAKVDALIRHYVEGEESTHLALSAGARAAVALLGHRPVGRVTRTDVVALVDKIRRGAGDQLMAVISKFYNDMADRGIEVPNPARNRFKVVGARRARTRTFSDAEFMKLWRALEEEGDPALAAFATLAFTGCRRREATQMRRSELDLEASAWTLPPERRKTGKHDPEPFVIHLHPYLVEALRLQPELEGSPFVFWGRRDRKPWEFHHALMQRLRALGIENWRLHDVRRYVRSGMARLGVSQTVAELCLGHTAKSGLVGVYDQHRYHDEKRDAWLKWGEHLVRLIGERK